MIEKPITYSPFKNQYFFSSEEVNAPEHFHYLKTGNGYLYYHPKLEVCQNIENGIEIIAVGILIDPLRPQLTNKDLTIELTLKSGTPENFLHESNQLSGRFVLFFSNGKEFLAVNDALVQRPVFYYFEKGHFYLTSNPKLYYKIRQKRVDVPNVKKAIMETKNFRDTEQSWLGEEYFESALKKLMPVHYLDIFKKRPQRIPYFNSLPKASYTEKETYLKQMLEGVYEALLNRKHKLIQPLTAGWDSRLLFAVSKNYRNKIEFYCFNRKKDSSLVDAKWARKIAEKTGVPFFGITPSPLKESFRKKFETESLFPRILPKTRNIQFQFENRTENTINMNGLGGEILRGKFKNRSKDIGANEFIETAHYPTSIEYFQRHMHKWLADVRPYCNSHNIPITDLYYWEQRIGNWGAIYAVEQDIAIEEICPFNNRQLLFTGLSIPDSERAFPKDKLYRSIMKSYNPELLDFPFNPPRNFLAKMKRLIFG